MIEWHLRTIKHNSRHFEQPVAVALKRSLLIFQLYLFFLRPAVHQNGQPVDFGVLPIPKSLNVIPAQCEHTVVYTERKDFSFDSPSAEQLGKQAVAAVWPHTQHAIGLQVFQVPDLVS